MSASNYEIRLKGQALRVDNSSFFSNKENKCRMPFGLFFLKNGTILVQLLLGSIDR